MKKINRKKKFFPLASHPNEKEMRKEAKIFWRLRFSEGRDPCYVDSFSDEIGKLNGVWVEYDANPS